MAMTFPSCATCNNCDDLLAEIRRRLWSRESGGDKGLLTRFAEQVFGCQTPGNTLSAHPSCAGHRMQGTWKGHNDAMKTQQGRVKSAIKDYDDNDCGDKVADPATARNTLREARRAAHSTAIPVPAGDYQGPPAPANVSMPRTWAQAAQDAAQGVCVAGFTAGGTVAGAAAGGVAGVGVGGVVGGALGGTGGTFVAPGVGTVGGGITGAGAGAVVGGVVGVGVGGVAGYNAGQSVGNWICR